MDDDQEVAVTQQLNLNRTGDGGLGLWEDDFTMSAHNLSINESSGSDLQDPNTTLLQKYYEFIRKHAEDLDPEFILSLLQSEIDNPRRLESVLCEMLNIPNASELIREIKKNPVKAGDKRGPADSNSHPEEAKKKKKDKDIYLRQLKEMFPDADGLFLITECQQLETWEDFSRFINTVMLSGVYPKKGAMDYTPKAATSQSVDVINVSDHSAVETSEEEISSSGLTESKKKKKQKKSKRTEKNVAIDLIDLSSHDTEIYEPPELEELQEAFNWGVMQNDPQKFIPEELQLLSTNITNDAIDELKDKFRATEYEALPTPGPSGERNRRNSRPNDGAAGKAFAQKLDEKIARKSSAAETRPKQAPVEVVYEDGDSDVSTTTQPMRSGSETEGAVEEEVSEEWLSEQTANLVRIFPNTDPSYLQEQVAKMKGSTEAVNEFVVAKLEKNDMPSRAEYEKKLEMEELQNRYTKNFSIEDFLRAVPEPWDYFKKSKRDCAKYKTHSLCYLKSTFRKRFVRDIIETFNKRNFNLYLTYQDLKREGKKTRSSQRSALECNQNRPTTIDIQFLQEVAFIENEDKIKAYLEAQRVERQIKFDEAKRAGTLLECECCFDNEILVEDMFYCPKDHAFCRACIKQFVEVEFSSGKHQFACLSSCDENLPLQVLQNVLRPELFSKILRAIQMEEIQAAGIEDLVQCPFCTYATIMPPEQKVLSCLNAECLKESCRLCRELNHIPLRCNEVEKSGEVRLRTFIENKMTEALVRTCYKCGKKFVKEDGCNKMTCTCGAKMCYVCRRPVSDYTHFNGQGGTEYQKCPLYSTNDELHVEVVRRIGEEAKAEILQANPNLKLLHDPTIIPIEGTNQGSLPGTLNGAALDVAMRAIRGTLEPEGREAEAHQHNRDRREIRREANPYYHRNYHRHRDPPESDNEAEEEEDCNCHRHRLHHHENRQRRHHNHHHFNAL